MEETTLPPRSELALRELDEQMRTSGLAASTRCVYAGLVRRFLTWTDREIADLGVEDVRDYLSHLQYERHASPPTRHTSSAALRFFFRRTLGQTSYPAKVSAAPARPAIRLSERARSLLSTMDDQMCVRGLADTTRYTYLRRVHNFLSFTERDVDELDAADAEEFLLYLARERGLQARTRNVVSAALRFFFETTLRQPGDADAIPNARREHRLPVVLSGSEIKRLLGVAPTWLPNVTVSAYAQSRPWA